MTVLILRKTAMGTIVSVLFAAGALAAQRPNLVFVFSDDHATQAISAYGGMLAEIAPTPNLDRIAEKGMLFSRCLVGNSICGPSRATILTGKHSHMNGFMVNESTIFPLPLRFQDSNQSRLLTARRQFLPCTPEPIRYLTRSN